MKKQIKISLTNRDKIIENIAKHIKVGKYLDNGESNIYHIEYSYIKRVKRSFFNIFKRKVEVVPFESMQIIISGTKEQCEDKKMFKLGKKKLARMFYNKLLNESCGSIYLY
jgi:hypothetical protein